MRAQNLSAFEKILYTTVKFFCENLQFVKHHFRLVEYYERRLVVIKELQKRRGTVFHKRQRPHARRIARAYAQSLFDFQCKLVVLMQRKLLDCAFVTLFVKQYIAHGRKTHGLHFV